jgi:RNA methyltransferase, TrmH family
LQLPIVSGTWHDLHALMTKYGMKMMAGHPESSSAASKKIYSLSKELADSMLNESLCLVLGSEGNGLSAETLQACELVNIPKEGTFESLNVSVAGGIFLFMLQPKSQIDKKNFNPKEYFV